jgi:hypothetical protein
MISFSLSFDAVSLVFFLTCVLLAFLCPHVSPVFFCLHVTPFLLLNPLAGDLFFLPV